MSYQTYITKAVICGSFDSNIADKSYLLFTREAGMIYAVAKSVREERSRQRFALQDFGLITVSLIKGRAGWRIGSVQSEGNVFSAASDRVVRGSVVRVVKFLRRFVGSEEPMPRLYDECMAGLTYLTQPDIPERALVEEIVQVRLLSQLGYIAASPALAVVIDPPLLVVAQNDQLLSFLPELKKITAQASLASHL